MTRRKSGIPPEEARARLRELLPPGSTVYTSLRHVSRSGMYRSIAVYAIVPTDNTPAHPTGSEPQWITGYVAAVLDERIDERDGLAVTGCGMDMGFHVVYNLAWALYGREPWACVGQRCPSNDHSNGDRDYSPEHMHTGDGGYALRQAWL